MIQHNLNSSESLTVEFMVHGFSQYNIFDRSKTLKIEMSL